MFGFHSGHQYPESPVTAAAALEGGGGGGNGGAGSGNGLAGPNSSSGGGSGGGAGGGGGGGGNDTTSSLTVVLGLASGNVVVLVGEVHAAAGGACEGGASGVVGVRAGLGLGLRKVIGMRWKWHGCIGYQGLGFKATEVQSRLCGSRAVGASRDGVQVALRLRDATPLPCPTSPTSRCPPSSSPHLYCYCRISRP